MKKLIRIGMLLLGLLAPVAVHAQAYQADDLLETILGGTPSVPFWRFDEGDFILQYNGDRSRTAIFDLSQFLTIGTRTMSFKNASYTLAGSNLDNQFSAQQTFDLQSNTNPPIRIPTTKSSGVSGGFPTGMLDISPTISDAGSGISGNVRGIRINPSVSHLNDVSFVGISMNMTGNDNGFGSASGVMSGLDFIVNFQGGGLILERGVTGIARNSGGGSVTTMFGSENVVSLQNGSNAIDVAGINAKIQVQGASSNISNTAVVFNSQQVDINNASGSINDLYHFKAVNASGAGTVNTQYGLHLANLTKGAANWAIYSLGGVSSHLGNFKFGANTSPTHRVDIAAGTTSVGAMRLVAGSLLSTADSSVVETSGDDIYYTIPTGEARKKIVLDNGTNLTSGTTPVATTNGRLTDGLILASGVYTPTLTGVANVAASTPYECQYMRVGSTVTVSGKVDIDPTAAAATQLGISLPIASNFGAQEDGAGTARSSSVQESAAILGDAANNRAEINFTAVSTANNSWYFTFTYQIL